MKEKHLAHFHKQIGLLWVCNSWEFWGTTGISG